jgi:hypothetical protein
VIELTEAQRRPRNVVRKYHRDPDYGFSLLYPETWHRFEFNPAVADGRGVLYSEDPDDLTTHLSIEARNLGTTVLASDLSDLRRGFLAGLRSVPGSRILRSNAYDVGLLIGVEAHQLYDLGEQRPRRWVRLLYKDAVQVRLVFQARDAAHFKYWLPSLKPGMTGFFFDGGLAPFTPGESAYDPDWLHALLHPDKKSNRVS